MALMHSQPTQYDALAPDFELPGTDGKIHRLQDFKQSKALVVVFMCNHCPYVIAVQDRINGLAKEFADRGVSLVGINPNDTEKYPDDRMEKMIERAKERGFVFPYLQDESQAVARAYDAVCTPDPYVYENVGDGEFRLRYHGRIDDSWKDESLVKRRDLALALESILAGRAVEGEVVSAMGCSIKWKTAPL